jgi:methionine synthase II (cobalamin-independent)
MMTRRIRMLFPTTLVGSMPQPDWLIDRARLAGRLPPRVRARELWRVILAPDRDVKYLPRGVAEGKLQATVAAARILRSESAGAAPTQRP